MNWKRFTRKTHYWASLAIAIPAAIVIGTGLLLQFKKQSDWIQPPSAKGTAEDLSISFQDILAAATTVSEAEISSWADIDRLDVRPSKGIVKVRSKNRWEVQLDTATGKVLQVSFRRSDLIESIHDGSFFHPLAKMWIFLPSGILLLLMWLTGIYLFILPYLPRLRRR